MQLDQWYVVSPGYTHQSSFTIPTVERIRKAVADAEVFFVSSDFDLRREFYCHDLESFVGGQKETFPKLLLQRRKDYESRYVELKKANREARSGRGFVSSDVGVLRVQL